MGAFWLWELSRRSDYQLFLMLKAKLSLWPVRSQHILLPVFVNTVEVFAFGFPIGLSKTSVIIFSAAWYHSLRSLKRICLVFCSAQINVRGTFQDFVVRTTKRKYKRNTRDIIELRAVRRLLPWNECMEELQFDEDEDDASSSCTVVSLSPCCCVRRIHKL